MNDFERAVAAAWIGRLGQHRVAELAEGLECGPTVDERAHAIASGITVDGLVDILLHGFRHHFHQTVYTRDFENEGHDIAELLLGLPVGEEDNRAAVKRVTQEGNAHARALLFVPRAVEFLPPAAATFTRVVNYPAMLEAVGGLLRVHVLTMHNTAGSWEDIVGQDVRRLITRFSSDKIHDQVMDFVRDETGVGVGQYIDFSQIAIEFVEDLRVDTFSGRFEVGPEGLTRYDTVGGAGRKSLRDAMPEQYERLVSADRITRVEIQMTDLVAGMVPGAQAILYPTTGKVRIRALLKGGDLFEFVEALV